MDQQKRCNGGNRGQLRPELGTEIRRKRHFIKMMWHTEMNKKIMAGKASSLDIAGLNSLIEWKIYRWAALRDKAKEGTEMQDQITIECRMDFKDKDKIPEVIKLACSMARTLAANIQLLDPVCKPECVVYTDNFMSPPEKINIYQDLIGKGDQELQESAGISSELLAAATE